MYFDVETTGYSGIGIFDDTHRIIQFAVVCGDAQFCTYVNPQTNIANESTEIHGITTADVVGAPTFDIVWVDFCKWVETNTLTKILVAHNCFGFDQLLIEKELKRFGLTSSTLFEFQDTEPIVRHQMPTLKSHSLKYMVQKFIPTYSYKAHDALEDAKALEALCIELNLITLPFDKSPQRKELRSIWPLKKHIESIRAKLEIDDCIDELRECIDNDEMQLRQWLHNNLTIEDDAIEYTVLRVFYIEPREFINNHLKNAQRTL